MSLSRRSPRLSWGSRLTTKAGRLSGGQLAQLALTLALARRPQLLVLDEPMAMLDPIARHDFMATVMMAVADDGVSVVLSSHVLAELERVADYLVLLSHAGRSTWRVRSTISSRAIAYLTGPAVEADAYRDAPVCTRAAVKPSRTCLVRTSADDVVPPGWEAHPLDWKNSFSATCASPETTVLSFDISIEAGSLEGDEMATLIAVASPRDDESMRPLPWRRMVWVTWRQHRAALIGVAASSGSFARRMDQRPSSARTLWRRDRLSPRGLVDLRGLISSFNGTRLTSANGLLLAGGARAHRGVPRGADAGSRDGDRHLPLRLDPGFRSVALDARQACGAAVVVTVAAAALSALFSWYYQPYFAAAIRTWDSGDLTVRSRAF